MEHVFLSLMEFRLKVENVQFVCTQLKNFTFSSELLQFGFRKLLRCADDKHKGMNSELRQHKKLMSDIPGRKPHSLTIDKQVSINFHRQAVSSRTDPHQTFTCEHFRFECCCEILKHAVKLADGTKTT